MDIKKVVAVSGATAAGLVATAGVASADQITIKEGDTLSHLAQEHGTTTDNLAAINNITDQNLIFAGEVLETEGTAQVAAPVQQEAAPVQQQAAPAQQSAPAAKPAASAPAGSGSTYDQFIANGGTAAMWQTIVVPESGGDPAAYNKAGGYRGLGQTKEHWGTGSVATQTKGMMNYATSRYGSAEKAVAFRQANGWW